MATIFEILFKIKKFCRKWMKSTTLEDKLKKKWDFLTTFEKKPIIFSKQISPFATYHNDVISDDIT